MDDSDKQKGSSYQNPHKYKLDEENGLSFETFISRYLGGFGKFQWMMLIICAVPCFAPSLHLMSWVFATSYTPDYKCRKDNTAVIGSCNCSNGIEFVGNVSYQNAITEFEIVCDRRPLKAFVQSCYYIGQMIGSLVLADISDRYGRKHAFIIAAFVQLFSTAWILVPIGVASFIMGRIGIGFAHYGLFSLPVVMALEFLNPNKRKWATFGAGCLFAIGQVLLGLIAMQEYDLFWFQFVIFCPMVLLIVCIAFIPESARWLISRNRMKDAEVIFRRIEKCNNSKLPENWAHIIKHDPSRYSETTSVLALIKTPNLRKRSIVAFILWPIVSMLYYGMATKMDLFGGSIYVTFISGAIIEIPASAVATLLIDRVGRKALTICGLAAVFLCLASSFFIQNNAPLAIILAQILIARFAITITYATIYTYTPELFPTVLRTRAVGLASFCARVGGIGSSFLVMYLIDLYGRNVVTIPFMITALIAIIAVFAVLPETAGRNLPQTIEDVENQTAVGLEAENNDALLLNRIKI